MLASPHSRITLVLFRVEGCYGEDWASGAIITVTEANVKLALDGQSITANPMLLFSFSSCVKYHRCAVFV